MSQTSKLDIGLKEIRDSFLLPRLASTPFRYKVFISDGEYVKAVKKGNQRVGTVNAIMNAESTDIMILGGGLKAVSMICSVTFLLPINDNADGETHGYDVAEEFKNSLNSIFPVSEMLTIKANNIPYVGVFSGGYPVAGMLMQRQYIGTSIEYTCTFEVAYLQNGINSSAVKFYLGDNETPLPVSAFNFNRRSTVLANVYSNTTNCEAEAYAESSAFGVDLAFPALSPANSQSGKLFFEYVKGEMSANSVVRLRIQIDENGENGGLVATTITKDMIISEVAYEGGGIDNMSMRVSLIPYIPAEDIDV